MNLFSQELHDCKLTNGAVSHLQADTKILKVLEDMAVFNYDAVYCKRYFLTSTKAAVWKNLSVLAMLL